jgi:hypothetical protein
MNQYHCLCSQEKDNVQNNLKHFKNCHFVIIIGWPEQEFCTVQTKVQSQDSPY